MHICKIMRDDISMDRQNTLKRDNAYNMKHSSLKMYVVSRFAFNIFFFFFFFFFLQEHMFMSKWVIIRALQ